MIRTTSCVLLASLILWGCSKPSTVDGHSAKAFSDSVLEISHDMPSLERQTFVADIKTFNAYYGGYGSTLDNPSTEFLASINGKSVEAIHAESTKIHTIEAVNKIKELSSKFQSLDEEIKSIDYDRALQQLVVDNLQRLPILNVKLVNVKHLDMAGVVTSTIVFTVKNDTSGVATITDATLSGMFGQSRQAYNLGNNLLDDCFRAFGNNDKGRILPNEKKEFSCELAGEDLSQMKDMEISITGGSLNGIKANEPGLYKSENNIAGLEDKIRGLKLQKLKITTQIHNECSQLSAPTLEVCSD